MTDNLILSSPCPRCGERTWVYTDKPGVMCPACVVIIEGEQMESARTQREAVIHAELPESGACPRCHSYCQGDCQAAEGA